MKNLIKSETMHGTRRSYFFNLYEDEKGKRTMEIKESRKVSPNRYSRETIHVYDGDIKDFFEIITEFIENLEKE